MAPEKPTIILIHGAYHSPEAWYLVKPRLEALSYSVHAIQLVTAEGPEGNPESTHCDDIARIHETIVPLMEAGKEIVLVAHSYGGTPATASVEGHSIEERAAKGRDGGVKAILYVAGVLAPRRGVTVVDALKTEPDWVEPELPWARMNINGKETMYHDCAEDVKEKAWKRHCEVRHAVACFLTPIESLVPAELQIPKTYLMCENDRVVPFEVQERFVADAPGMKTLRCSAGHSPFLSQPDFVVKAIEEVSGNC